MLIADELDAFISSTRPSTATYPARYDTHHIMSTIYTFERIPASDVSDAMLVEAASLFSSAYGVWGPLAPKKMGKFCKPGMYFTSCPVSLTRTKLNIMQETA